MSEVWVVDASPLIVLAKAGYLNLLTDMADEVWIPEPVAVEVLSGSPTDPARQALEAGWGNRVAITTIPAVVAALGLDPGETAVLAVALGRSGSTVVLDDRKAREAARALGLPVMGTLGIILGAKREGRIPSASDALKDLRAAGLYLDDALLQSVLPSVGETWP